MVASVRPLTRPVARPRSALGTAEHEVVGRLATWLLGAVALDLVLTRFVVRLAMLVPKGEPWTTLGALSGRIGAGADALVPIVGLILLGALLFHAGRVGGGRERAVVVGIGVVAAGGLALVLVPPTPAVVLALDGLVVAIAVAAGIRLVIGARLPAVASTGLAVLAASVALAAGARVVAAGIGGSSGLGGSAGLLLDAVGQCAFVLGAGLVGLAGAAELRRPGSARGRLVAAVVVALVAVAVLAAGTRSPLMLGALAIWSVGLAGAVPTPLVAVAVGLAVAGLPLLHRRAPTAAVGASVVLLAGYGLAASGLVLAGLLGLVVAGTPASPGQPGRST